jgi:hypothetical protein
MKGIEVPAAGLSSTSSNARAQQQSGQRSRGARREEHNPADCGSKGIEDDVVDG